MSRRAALASIILVALSACGTSSEPILGETGETGDTGDDEDAPLPLGDDCGEHWYGIDGAPVDVGEATVDETLVAHVNLVEFTGPPPTPTPTPAPLPVDRAIAALGYEDIADFDGDGSSDILWLRPEGSSPIWRGVPGEQAFACDPPVDPPANAYPVGFGGAY